MSAEKHRLGNAAWCGQGETFESDCRTNRK